MMTATARNVTQALRKLFPHPITLRTTVNPACELEITLGRGAANFGDQLASHINRATGTHWAFVRRTNLRGGSNARLTYRLTQPPATFEKIGEPHEWKLGQADERTVEARHAAVHDTKTPTGADATPDQLVVHIELGTPGQFVRRDPESDSISWVRFAGDTEPSMVHSDDVVVVKTDGWFSCNQMDAHPDHGQAVSPECLLPLPDVELVGPELVQVAPGRYETADRIEVTYHPDDQTWWAYGRNAWGMPDSVCAGQPTLTSTYRWINGFRERMAERRDRDHGQALKIIEAREALEQAQLVAAQAAIAQEAEAAAGMPDTYAGFMQHTDVRVKRAQLTLDLAEGLRPGNVRLVVLSSSETDGGDWKIQWASLVESKPGETASSQALRYADEHFLTRKPYLVQVFTDPAADTPDGEWTNLINPCPAGQHNNGTHRVLPGARRADGSTVQASRCAVCMHSLWRVTPCDSRPYPWLLEGDDLPPVEPGVIYLALARITTDHYGMQINDGLGVWHELNGVGPFDPETGNVDVTVAGHTVAMPGGTMVQLRPAPPKSGLDDDGLDDAQTQTQTPAQTQTPDAIDGESGQPGLGLDQTAAIRYRVTTQTQTGRWRAVQTGVTPPGFRACRPDLDMVADTILGNLHLILGLQPGQTLPAVRVQTWNWPTGLTGGASRLAA